MVKYWSTLIIPLYHTTSQMAMPPDYLPNFVMGQRWIAERLAGLCPIFKSLLFLLYLSLKVIIQNATAQAEMITRVQGDQFPYL